MIIPPAEVIEGTVDSYLRNLQNIDVVKDYVDEAYEAHGGIGEASAIRLGITFPLSNDFVIGYTLGLDVARQLIQTSVILLDRDVPPKDIL